MISKRHITARGHSVLQPKDGNPINISQSTLSKRLILNRASCNSGTCDIKLNPT